VKKELPRVQAKMLRFERTSGLQFSELRN
jgi:hypothetical protein